MFSNHLRKIDEAPSKILLLVAAALVMVCQLVALALVAGEQVQKAQMRGDSQASRHVVTASCVESSRGVAVKDCFQHSSFDPEARQVTNRAKRSAQIGAAAEAAELDTVATPATPATPAASVDTMMGFISASFAVR